MKTFNILFFLLGTLISAQEPTNISKTMFSQYLFPTTIKEFQTSIPEKIVINTIDNNATIQSIDDDWGYGNIYFHTIDGLYYSFVIRPDAIPSDVFKEVKTSDAMNYDMAENTVLEPSSKRGKTKTRSNGAPNFGTENAKLISSYLLKTGNHISNRNFEEYENVRSTLKGVFANEKNLFFILEFNNKSNVKYDIENIRFITSPIEKEDKMVEADEIEYTPIFSNPHPYSIGAKENKRVVFVFDKFTINEEKHLRLILTEKSGERTITLKIKPKFIYNAKAIQ